ncbi:hypothetical protein AB0M79_09440 [Polymorphospora sp. NPDC051019]|uniref:dTMP kinase n=1 Tax=Polymorphospora sp. NPDC051019 TaxID=3155725 RepID=UPI003421F335
MRQRSCWVSVEGVNGVGKTYLTGRLATQLGTSWRLLSELTDHGADQLTGQVIAALARPGGTFLRTGNPLTETFALLASKVHEYERLATATGGEPGPVLEDRGVDSVAIYQAAILAGTDRSAAPGLVARIHAAAVLWRPLPALTLLIVDDLDSCVARFETRLSKTLDTTDRDLLAHVDDLYKHLAQSHPHRIRIVDRTGRGEDDVLDEMYAHCLTAEREAKTS